MGGKRGSLERMTGMAAKGTRISATVRQEAAARRREDLFPVIEEFKTNGAASLRAAGIEWRWPDNRAGWAVDGDSGNALDSGCVIGTGVFPFASYKFLSGSGTLPKLHGNRGSNAQS